MTKYFNKTWFLVFLIFPFYNPTVLKYIPGLTIIYDAIQIWKLIAILCIMFSYLGRRRISGVISIIIVLEIISIGTSLANGVYDSKIFTNALLAVGMAMLTELAIKINFKKYILVYFNILFGLVMINFILCLVYPTGLRMATLYTNWTNPLHFLGIDNAMIKDLLPLLIMGCYIKLCGKYDSSIHQGRKLNFRLYIAYIISFFTLVIVDSASGLLSFIIFSVLMLVYSGILKRKYPYKLMIAIYLLFMIFVVVAGSNIQIVNLIVALFGRTQTFTGRSLLWSTAIKQIIQRPIIGYGYTSGNIQVWGGYFSSHNLFLEMLLHGGVLYFGVFVILTIYALVRNHKASVQYSNLFFMGAFTYLLVGLMETGINPFYFALMVMACYQDANPNEKMKIFIL